MKNLTKIIGITAVLMLFACANNDSTATDRNDEDDNSYEIVETWMDNDSIIKSVTLLEQDGSFHIDILEHKGHGRFLDVVESQTDGLACYDFENNEGEYFIVEENGNFAIYDSIGKRKEIKLYQHP